jgi:hypothetical protein
MVLSGWHHTGSAADLVDATLTRPAGKSMLICLVLLSVGDDGLLTVCFPFTVNLVLAVVRVEVVLFRSGTCTIAVLA